MRTRTCNNGHCARGVLKVIFMGIMEAKVSCVGIKWLKEKASSTVNRWRLMPNSRLNFYLKSFFKSHNHWMQKTKKISAHVLIVNVFCILFIYLSGCLFIRLFYSYYHYHAFGEIKIYNTMWVKTRCSAIAERPRCRVRYSFSQKWKTGTGKQYFTDSVGLSSTIVT